jgi:hypothetical protein
VVSKRIVIKWVWDSPYWVAIRQHLEVIHILHRNF